MDTPTQNQAFGDEQVTAYSAIQFVEENWVEPISATQILREARKILPSDYPEDQFTKTAKELAFNEKQISSSKSAGK